MPDPQETEWPAKGCELYGHNWRGKQPCICGAEYVELNEVERRIANAVKYDLHDEAGRDEHAERVGRNIARALGLTQEWAVKDRYGIACTAKNGHAGAARIADRINMDYADTHKYVAGASMCAPEAEPVSRSVTPWVGGHE